MASGATFAVETHGLSRRFGAKVAVADLSLAIPRGEIFGFLGPNGAGKTTSVKMLLALVAPSGGAGTVLGAPSVALIAPARDEFSDPARLETLAASLPARPWVRAIDTDHFFSDALDELAAACGEAITWAATKS